MEFVSRAQIQAVRRHRMAQSEALEVGPEDQATQVQAAAAAAAGLGMLEVPLVDKTAREATAERGALAAVAAVVRLLQQHISGGGAATELYALFGLGALV